MPVQEHRKQQGQTVAAAKTHLHCKRSEYYAAKYGVSEHAVKHVPLAMDLAGVDLVEELHEDEGVEDDGVVLGGGRVQGSITPVVNVENPLP